MKPDEMLDRAADVIEERGHTKHIRENERGEVCLLGAFGVVTCGSAWQFDYFAADPLGEALHALFIEVGYLQSRSSATGQVLALVDWNNAPERTPDEVIDHLRWTAKGLREEAA